IQNLGIEKVSDEESPSLEDPVTKLSQKMSKPTRANLDLAKHVLRYLRGTSEQGPLISWKSRGKIFETIMYRHEDIKYHFIRSEIQPASKDAQNIRANMHTLGRAKLAGWVRINTVRKNMGPHYSMSFWIIFTTDRSSILHETFCKQTTPKDLFSVNLEHATFCYFCVIEKRCYRKHSIGENVCHVSMFQFPDSNSPKMLKTYSNRLNPIAYNNIGHVIDSYIHLVFKINRTDVKQTETLRLASSHNEKSSLRFEPAALEVKAKHELPKPKCGHGLNACSNPAIYTPPLPPLSGIVRIKLLPLGISFQVFHEAISMIDCEDVWHGLIEALSIYVIRGRNVSICKGDKIKRDKNHNRQKMFRFGTSFGHKWLMSQDAFTLHKSARRNFKRNRVFVGGIDEEWQMDLADMQSLKQYNDGYRYLLVCIDVFSKYAWLVPIKSKTGPAIVEAFKVILSSGRKPQKIMTDQGTEFFNKPFQTLLNGENIQLFNTFNETKASVVERVILGI
ncbi:uncharacterized transposon-derived, partial [Paramuricea clavata]